MSSINNKESTATDSVEDVLIAVQSEPTTEQQKSSEAAVDENEEQQDGKADSQESESSSIETQVEDSSEAADAEDFNFTEHVARPSEDDAEAKDSSNDDEDA